MIRITWGGELTQLKLLGHPRPHWMSLFRVGLQAVCWKAAPVALISRESWENTFKGAVEEQGAFAIQEFYAELSISNFSLECTKVFFLFFFFSQVLVINPGHNL